MSKPRNAKEAAESPSVRMSVQSSASQEVVVILGLVGAVAGVLAIDGHGVASARLQHKLSAERGADARITNGWEKGVQFATQFCSSGSTYTLLGCASGSK